VGAHGLPGHAMRRSWLAGALALLLSVIGALRTPPCLAEAAAGEVSADPYGLASPDGRYPRWLDPSVAPGSDFYRFANGGWLNEHPIPPDRSYYGVDTLLEQKNQTFIRELVESLSARDWPEGSTERKVTDFYRSGMDEAGIESAGLAPLAPELARIAAIGDRAGLLEEIAHLALLGITAPLQVGPMQDFKDSTRVIAFASQSGLGLPNRDYYLKPEPNFRAARAAYLEHVARMLELLGDAPEAARHAAQAVLALETRLAAASMPDAEQRNPATIYHPLSIQRARALTPHLDWGALLGSMGHGEIELLNVGMPQFFETVDRELDRTSLEDWRSYLRWQLIDGFAPYLPKAFVDEDFRMSSVLTGAKQLQARWLRVLRAEDDALGFALGRLYVEQRFSPAARAAAVAIVLRIRDALSADLATLSWMTPATRAAARRKLDLMELRVGYPDRWRDYGDLSIDRASYAGNVLRANQFEMRRQLAKIGKPVDRSEWYMTPQTVNAYYDPSMNSLNVPAGILQPPYFDPQWPDAANYGATGATVGHEMTHAFDDEGSKFDGHGNLKDWWAGADSRRFRRATRCIGEQYSRFTVSGGLHVQGALVTGEATADLGGLELAFRAWQQARTAQEASRGAEEASRGAQASRAPLGASLREAGARSSDAQEFFIAFAHSWAGALRPEQAQELVTTDPHPPAQFRTNATLANSPEFQQAFELPASSPMVNRDRCVIW
jgi:putative endopeptidase